MRAVLQRVSSAAVDVAGQRVGEIGQGLLVLLGVAKGDQAADAVYLARKATHLRIFTDEAGKMNRSLLDVGGEMLVVSQFTLYGNCRKGRRPSFDEAALPEDARVLYEAFINLVEQSGIRVSQGIFQADMQVSLTNDGPVTYILNTN